MRSREGKQRSCKYCGIPTRFLHQEHGEGRWLDCCVQCGENPARRLAYEIAAKAKKKEAA